MQRLTWNTLIEIKKLIAEKSEMQFILLSYLEHLSHNSTHIK